MLHNTLLIEYSEFLRMLGVIGMDVFHLWCAHANRWENAHLSRETEIHGIM